MSFNGFSQAEIAKLNKSNDNIPESRDDGLNNDKSKQSTKNPRRNPPKPLEGKSLGKTTSNANIIKLNGNKQPSNSQLTRNNSKEKMTEKSISNPASENQDNPKKENEAEKIIESEEKPTTTTSIMQPVSPIDVTEFEAKQKIMEEQNRKRKELLAKALAERTQQTLEETQKLNVIKEELKTLDAMLSNDVKILRKRIEEADIEYTESRKKYDRIEKEFLQSKIVMLQKMEKKEMLTQHLYTIINTNEERKAEKLTELMEKLQIDVDNNKT